VKHCRKSPFDPKLFLAKVGAEKTRTGLRRGQLAFSQGAPADSVFYIEKGKIELRIVAQQGKEAILATLGVGDFLWRGVPCRPALAHGDGCRRHGLLCYAPSKIGNDRGAPG